MIVLDISLEKQKHTKINNHSINYAILLIVCTVQNSPFFSVPNLEGVARQALQMEGQTVKEQ